MTGYTGRGDYYNSKALIDSWVNYLNNKYKGEISHWVGEKQG